MSHWFDEIQNTPELLAHIRARIDAAQERRGQWLLTGSQEAPLMRGVTESMAGRAALLELWPLSTQETLEVSLLRGGFPEVVARPASATLWYRSYIQTYLERDVEVDFLVPLGDRRLALVAVKAGATARPETGNVVATLMASARGYETHGSSSIALGDRRRLSARSGPGCARCRSRSF